MSIVRHFHECHQRKNKDQQRVLDRFVRRVRSQDAAIISFNWDYELDYAFFGDNIGPGVYGLRKGTSLPVLLKPHGSLNWYEHAQGRHLKKEKSLILWGKDSEQIHCFLRWREPRTSENRKYIPWIVPPTQAKSFEHPMLKSVWAACVSYLSLAHDVFFLGYSLPVADWHSRYVLRCDFHNQVDGIPPHRKQKSGRAKVYIINPDQAAFQRIQDAVGWPCFWNPAKVEDWLASS